MVFVKWYNYYKDDIFDSNEREMRNRYGKKRGCVINLFDYADDQSEILFRLDA